jgi:hypothetical protein
MRRYFYLESATRDYSEMTPGNELDISCGKGVWKFNPYTITTEGFEKMFTSAQTCRYYEEKR